MAAITSLTQFVNVSVPRVDAGAEEVSFSYIVEVALNSWEMHSNTLMLF